MIKMLIDNIVWDPKIYPREKWNMATIDRYTDAMISGAAFPALTIEKETNRLLDGKHRFEAYKKAGILEVPVEGVVVPDGIPIKLFAASLSARHGDRMSNSDLRVVVREAWGALDEAKGPGKLVAEMLGISAGTVSGFVSDLLAKRREDRRATALRLSMLGWTQREIAERLKVTQPTIMEDLKENFRNEEIFQSGHLPEEIALRLGLPVQVVLAIQFDKLSDQERLKKLNIKIQPYDVWNFSGCHDLMGDKHPGRIPGELVCQVLYFYTNPGALVVDGMGGSGTTSDASLLMGRKARCYDIDLRHGRVDVEKHDLSNGWPEPVRKADLIFWDPPYYDKMDNSTIGDEGYIDGSISGLPPDEYLLWMSERFIELQELVKPGTKLAFLMSDWDSENAKQHKGHPGIYLWDYVAALQKAKWKVIRQIQCPLSTEQVPADIVNKFREAKRLARLNRYLLVCEKI